METLPDLVFRSMLIQAKGGHTEAIKCLYYQFQPAIFAFISRKVLSTMDREDITSEVFMTMVKDIRMARAEDEAAFRSWLFRIAEKALVRYYRSREKEQTVTIRMETVSHSVLSYDDPTQPIEVRETVSAVLKAINMLTTEKRQIVLSKVKGIPDAFLSQVLGKTESAIRVTRHRTVQFLQSKVGIAMIVTILTCSILLTGSVLGIIFVSRAEPGDPFYQIKQMVAPTSTPTPTQTPQIFIPSMIPTSTPSPTPSPTQTPTPTPTPTSTPVPTSNNNNLLPLPTVTLPRNTVCALGVCA